MTEVNKNKLPIWFWIISAVALIWNLLGVMAYIMQATMSDAVLAEMPDAQRVMYEALPAWYTAAFAIAVFGGALGCIALLLRKKWALWALIISFIGVILQNLYFWVLSGVGSSLAGFELYMTLAIPVVGVLLIWFARSSITKNWLK